MNESLPCPARDLPASEFQSRVKRLMTLERRLRLDTVLLFSELTNYYFTGLCSDNGVLVVSPAGEPVFRTDFRYLVMARRVAPWLTSKTLWSSSREKEELASLGRSWRRLGYEGSISATRFLALQEALPDVEWVNISKDLAMLRAVKSTAEQEVIRNAVLHNDAVLQTWLGHLEEGLTEWQIRTKIRGLMDYVGQGEAFDTIVCVGKNAAECHHEPGETVFTKGRSLLIDMGVKLDHYCSDMTRCLYWGKPTKLFLELHGIVHRANQAAIRAIKPGVPCCEIDAVARRLIDRDGYGKAFEHSLGHGVGLFIHESPSFSPCCDTPLKPGMVITVEPGIYLPGRAGVRIEDVILVTRTGCEVLSSTPHDLFF